MVKIQSATNEKIGYFRNNISLILLYNHNGEEYIKARIEFQQHRHGKPCLQKKF